MASDCIFCCIASGEAPADILYRDDEVTAFWDGRPAAPVHILVIPNRHIATINDAVPEDAALLGRLILTARTMAEAQGVAESGYRLVFNVGEGGGQSVYHIHLHLIAGARLPVFHH